MGTHISGGSLGGAASAASKPIVALDTYITTLGSTKTTLFPFFESQDDLVRSYKENYHTLIPTSNGPGFDALMHNGVHSYLFDPNNAMYLLGEDSTDYDMGNGSTDEVFSVGAWILPYDIATVDIMAKYDTNVQRTWRFGIDGSNKLFFEQYDESNAVASETGTSTTSVTANQWTFVVWTYDGGETAPVIAFYQNATADATVGTTESGTYVAMENNTAKLTIGASLATGVPTNPFNGRIALPFIAGKQLTQANVTTLYGAGRVLLGI